ncbi:MAG: F0F1 ATP synthase subunit alpha, partial [Clostridia bacterium]|nr:F0F1 ATP synthase subunit alpha [Clostridia bacterium]
GERIVEVLKQDRNSPVDVALQVAIIYAVVNELLSDIAVEDVKRFEAFLFEHLTANEMELLDRIKQTGVLSDEDSEKLTNAINRAKEKFANKA